MLASVLAFLLMLDVPTAPLQRPPEVKPVPRLVERPIWTRLPKDPELSCSFPAQAAASRISWGRASLRCTANAQGRMGECRVTRQSPTGFGFDAAAVHAARGFQLQPTDGEGYPVAGRLVLLEVIMRAPSEDPQSKAMCAQVARELAGTGR